MRNLSRKKLMITNWLKYLPAGVVIVSKGKMTMIFIISYLVVFKFVYLV